MQSTISLFFPVTNELKSIDIFFDQVRSGYMSSLRGSQRSRQLHSLPWKFTSLPLVLAEHHKPRQFPSAKGLTLGFLASLPTTDTSTLDTCPRLYHYTRAKSGLSRYPPNTSLFGTLLYSWNHPPEIHSSSYAWLNISTRILTDISYDPSPMFWLIAYSIDGACKCDLAISGIQTHGTPSKCDALR